MKNLIMFLAVFTLVFQSCNNDDDDQIDDAIVSPYAGTWSGTYAGDDSGTWTMLISDSGVFVSGSSYSNNAQESQTTISSTVNADGSTTSVSENGTIGTGQFDGNKITGTWVNPNFTNASGVALNGTSTGSKE